MGSERPIDKEWFVSHRIGGCPIRYFHSAIRLITACTPGVRCIASKKWFPMDCRRRTWNRDITATSRMRAENRAVDLCIWIVYVLLAVITAEQRNIQMLAY